MRSRFKAMCLCAFVCVCFLFLHCGSTPQLESPSSPSQSDDPTITTANSGETDNAPAISELDSDTLIVSCDGKDTDDPDTDFVTVTCSVGDEDLVTIFYCTDGIVYREVSGSDEATELFESVTVTCSDNGGPTLEEEELIISAVSEEYFD